MTSFEKPNALETKWGGENSWFWKYSAEVVNDVRKGAKIQICFEHTLKTFPVKEIQILAPFLTSYSTSAAVQNSNVGGKQLVRHTLSQER